MVCVTLLSTYDGRTADTLDTDGRHDMTQARRKAGPIPFTLISTPRQSSAWKSRNRFGANEP